MTALGSSSGGHLCPRGEERVPSARVFCGDSQRDGAECRRIDEDPGGCVNPWLGEELIVEPRREGRAMTQRR
jgi:hypothetical protein